jgi:asparagine synthase (glutamine-hydrolysing)
MKIFLEGAKNNQHERHYFWQIYFPDKDRMELFKTCVSQNFKRIGFKIIEKIFLENDFDRINKMLYSDFKILLPYDMLNKVDWMSMKNSLEVRSPLLDYRVAEFAFSLNGNMKIKKNQLKYILKKSFMDWLPKEIHHRKKQGFEIPIGEWFRRNIKFQKIFWEVVQEDKKITSNFFNYKKIQKLFEEHKNRSRDNSHKLWAIFVFHWWIRGKYGPNV